MSKIEKMIQQLPEEKIEILIALLTAPENEWEKLGYLKDRIAVLKSMPEGEVVSAMELAETMNYPIQSVAQILSRLSAGNRIQIIKTATITVGNKPVVVDLPRNYYMKG